MTKAQSTKASQPADKSPEELPLHIVEMRAENFKRLRAVCIRPDGSLITISGRNRQGKTSVLDVISAALGGKDFVPRESVRTGEKRAALQVTLTNGMVVTREFKAGDDGGRLVVEYRDKSRPKSPQAVLNELWSTLAIDPIEFMRKPPKDKFDTLKKLVPGVDFEAIERANTDDAAERTIVGRRQREQQGAADAIHVSPGTPIVAVDEDKLIQELNGAATFNADIASRKLRRRQAEIRCETLLTSAATLRKSAQDSLDEAARVEGEAQELSERLEAADPLPAEKDTEVLSAALLDARAVNAQVTKVIERERHLAATSDAKAQYDALTSAIDERNRQKVDAIAAAKMPIEGLGLGDGFVTLAGVPIEQASGEEQLRASTAIAMALHPKLRVILIRDGSLLDTASLTALGKIAAANEFQVFVERVSDGGATGIVIEDGEVVS